jgi:hypothetical protein
MILVGRSVCRDFPQRDLSTVANRLVRSFTGKRMYCRQYAGDTRILDQTDLAAIATMPADNITLLKLIASGEI